MTTLTIVVPTFNELDNIERLVRAIEEHTVDIDADVLFVDDSNDGLTPDEIRRVAADSSITVRLIHREGENRTGGLAGAVREGLRHAPGEWVIVMDGDLQHPPSRIPDLFRYARISGDMCIASRYCGSGDADGLNGGVRHLVSRASTILARSSFPRSVAAKTTDPMTGFFCVRKAAVNTGLLHVRGFKILFEILGRHPKLRVGELSFHFGERFAGESKASLANGLQFFAQLFDLRVPRSARFALVGASGVLVNLLIFAGLLHLGTHEVIASVLGTVVAMCTNFVLQERAVFHDLRHGSKNRLRQRFAKSLAVSGLIECVRVPAFVGLIALGSHQLLAQLLTVGAAAALRYKLTHRVYRPEPVVVIPSPSAEMKVVEPV